MTSTVTQELARALVDDEYFCEMFIIIEDRDGKLVRFKFNPIQQQLNGGFTGRDLVLKPRQIGSTTLYLAKGYKRVITEGGINAVVVAHEEFLTKRLLNRVRLMHQRLPLPDGLKPELEHDAEYQMSFPKKESGTQSTFYIGTAGAKTFGRGEPIHEFIGSEFAFWPNPWKILTPVMQAVPLGGNITLESTPNGEGTEREPNAFYELVQEALDGNSVWALHEIPWWMLEEYRIPAGSKYALVADRTDLVYTAEELDLILRVGWRDEEAADRIRWRRRKISEIHSSFWQEFYEDIVSCFMSTKEPFYDYVEMDKLRQGCYDPSYGFKGAKVWFTPEDKIPYSIAVDPGQGKATRSVATVWRHDLERYTKVRHEATLSGKYTSDVFAPMVMELAKYYNGALIVCEANGHGAAFCGEVKNYPHLYYRTDIVSGISSKQIGWMTTGPARIGATGTKIYAMTCLQGLLGQLETHDFDLVREMRQVKYSGDSVQFLGSDDFHDSAMIMAATRSGRPQKRGFLGRAGWNW